MHGGIPRSWATAVAAAVVLGSAAVGWGQAVQPVSGVEQSYLSLADADASATQMQLISAPSDGDKKSLEARVADLEKALKKAEDKAKADKAKAAGKPSAAIGGMFQMDYNLFNQSPANRAEYGDFQDGVAFRRARLSVSGAMFDIIDYKVEYDFAGYSGFYTINPANGNAVAPPSATALNGAFTQSTGFKDVYFTVNELPVLGHVRFGHMKECFGLDQLTSDRFSTFMERNIADEGAIVPARNVGVMAFDWAEDQRATWAIGAFRQQMVDNPPVRLSDNGGTAVTMRGTWLPWYDECTEGRGLFHLGGGYSYRDVDTLVPAATAVSSTNLSMAARPEAYLTPTVVGFSIADAEHYDLFNVEAAMVYGSLSVQSEYFGSSIRRTGGATAYVNGYYAYFSYFLTGEHRPYNRQNGTFDRVKPFENFFRVKAEDGCVYTGKGAWELAYRWSYLDLQDPALGVNGGRAYDHTLGVNWYLNPYLRLMWNYVHTDIQPFANGRMLNASTTPSSADIFEMRAAFDF